MRALTPMRKYSGTRPSRVIALILAATLGLGATTFTAPAAKAQGMFSPAIIVNDRAVTNYEIDQRVRLLQAFNTPGNLQELAREQLIEERLKLDELERAGLRLDDAALQIALEDFAGRASVTLDQFTAQLAQAGIDQATLRDFVRVGVSWRDFVRLRFESRAEITEAEVDAALGQAGGATSAIEVLLSEIIIPAPPPQAQAALAEAQRISQFTSTAAFEEAARRVSALPSREQGGRMDWLPIANYPAGLRTLILNLAPGEVTPPLPIENGVALFQMRAVREVPQGRAEPAAIEYAAFYIPGGLTAPAVAEAQSIALRVDTCDDLYGVAQGLPPERLQRQSVSPSEIPQDVALELARLDPGEVSFNVTRAEGQTLVFLMLCNRTALPLEEIDRDAVRGQLRGQRLAGFGDGLLADLRASAIIRTP